jgi:hypothetical protein
VPHTDRPPPVVLPSREWSLGSVPSVLSCPSDMGWITTLDTRASRWPRAARWPYVGLKWLLILAGAYLVLGTIAQRLNPDYWRNLFTIR